MVAIWTIPEVRPFRACLGAAPHEQPQQQEGHSLQSLNQLRELNLFLGLSEITQGQVDRLKQQLPDCQIRIHWRKQR